MDATVGAMLDKLDKLGIADNTLFVFVSDHGTHGKFSLHDHNGTAIPCIIRWPGVIKPGSVCSNFVQNTDMVPSFFDAAGADIPDGYRMDGKSIMPILSDPSAEVHDHLYFELGYGRAVRTKDWKYIAIRYSADQFEKIKRQPLLKIAQYLSYQGGAKNASRHMMSRPHYLEPDQLYNLANDPLEMKNLAKNPRFKAQLEKMRGLLTAKLKAQGRPFGEFVLGADSVQAEEIWPYLEKMKQLRPVKKGFEIIGDATNAPAGTPAKELIPVAGAGIKLLTSSRGSLIRKNLLMSIIKDERIDTKDMKQLIKLVRKTFNPIRMASGLVKQNNTQVA